MKNLTIRPMEPSDLEGWRALWDGYLTFYESALTEEMTALTWSRLHDMTVPLHGWIALLDGKPVGFTHSQEHLSTWSAGPYVYLEDLFVDVSARGSGAGRALINAVYDHAGTVGAAKVYWQTARTNTTARHLYDSIAEDSGFMVYQRKENSSGA